MFILGIWWYELGISLDSFLFSISIIFLFAGPKVLCVAQTGRQGDSH